MNWFEFSLSGFLAVFVVLNVLNVVIQTVKSIATIKCGAWVAAGINALAYGLYTVVVVYMNADGLGLLWKAIIIGLANLLGVYVVKVIEIKSRKDKLWKVEATIHSQGIEPKYDDCIIALKGSGVPFNYIDAEKYIIINCYCATQSESSRVKNILNEYGAKYFVSESKTL
jgi:uncharacterized protein YebE (UPF0316 family)